MNKCVECGDWVAWNPRSYVCGECLEEEHNIKMVNEDRVVEATEKSWF